MSITNVTSVQLVAQCLLLMNRVYTNWWYLGLAVLGFAILWYDFELAGLISLDCETMKARRLAVSQFNAPAGWSMHCAVAVGISLA